MATQSQDLGGPLKATIDQRDGATSVVLKGYINDATELASLVRLPGTLRIDLAGVERINSVGVKTWVHFVRDREKAGNQRMRSPFDPVDESESSPEQRRAHRRDVRRAPRVMTSADPHRPAGS